MPRCGKRLFATCCNILGCLLVLLCAQYTQAACNKLMRWNDDPPYSFVNKETPGRVQGISVDVAREALRRMGCTLTLIKLPWARALEELKTGRIDLISGAYKTPEREQYALYSTEGVQSPNVLFVRKADSDQWKIGALADLKGTNRALGVQINVSYSKEYDALKQQAWFRQMLTAVNERQSLWRMLMLKRIDAVFADVLTGRMELKQLGLLDQVVQVPFVLSDDPAFFAFSRATTDQAFVDRFDQVVQQMRKDGTFKAAENRYLQ